MSSGGFEAARALIADEPDADFVGPQPAARIRSAESALGLAFPPSYRSFLEEFGAGDVAGQEFYGIIGDDFEASGVPDAVWLTLRQRRESGLPNGLVLVYTPGDGSFWAIDTTSGGEEGPIVTWVPGISEPGDSLERVGNSFGEVMAETLREAIEV